MKAFSSLADIEALERRPLAEVAPHRTPYGLIRAAAERFPIARPSPSCTTPIWRASRAA